MLLLLLFCTYRKLICIAQGTSNVAFPIHLKQASDYFGKPFAVSVFSSLYFNEQVTMVAIFAASFLSRFPNNLEMLSLLSENCYFRYSLISKCYRICLIYIQAFLVGKQREKQDKREEW